MQCSRDVENWGKVSMHYVEWEAVAWPQQGIRANKITSKLELGLNFAVNVDFWVFNDDLNKKKKLKAKTWFLLFFYDVKNGYLYTCWYFLSNDWLEKQV